MAAAVTPRLHTYTRNFGHCVISWKIKNFSLAVCNPGTEILTEEFTVSCLTDTRWRLGFRVESGDGGKIRIFLKRISGESNESFRTSWKMTLLNAKDETASESENQVRVRKDAELKIDEVSTSDIIRSLPAEKPDEVKIAFQMIVQMNIPTLIPTPRDEAIATLVEDMKIIAKEALLHDVTVVLSEKEMTSHRAVLCPRSDKLSRFSASETRQIQLSLREYDAVNRIFVYLYSGDLRFILDPPSIPVYDCLVHLDIKELRDCYPHEKISLETAIEATGFTFRWTVEDFDSSDELRESEVFEADGMDSRWQLRIYPKGLTEGAEFERNYVYIEALAVSCERPQDVYVNFVAKNDKGIVTVAKRTYGKITSGKTIGVFFMRIGAASIAKSVVDKVLDITFDVHTATGEINSTITNTQPPTPFNLTNYDTYRILSNYLGILQTESLYSDITLVVQDQEYKAHKFLLAGRSTTFSRMIEGMKSDSSTLKLHSMNKHVFRVFLDFVYTASMTDIDISVLIPLHEIAVHFQVKSLRNVCEKLLGDQLTPENCCFLLIFADERHAAALKTRSLHYLAAYRDVIIENEGWKRMEEKNPALFNDVLIFLGNSPQEPQEP